MAMICAEKETFYVNCSFRGDFIEAEGEVKQ